MVTERQKYISEVFRAFGFALLTPLGSILFQWIVLEQGAFFDHFFYAVVVFFIGILFIFSGYFGVMSKEKR